MLSWAAESTGDHVDSVRCAEEALEIGYRLGDDRLIGNAARVFGLGGPGTSPEKAAPFPRRWPTSGEPETNPGCCWWLLNLAALELADENWQAAAEFLEEDLAICEDSRPAYRPAKRLAAHGPTPRCSRAVLRKQLFGCGRHWSSTAV